MYRPAMSFRLLALACLIVACHHDPSAQDPSEKPERTPVGILIDGATSLKLRGDQLAKLRKIDGDLTRELAKLDTKLRNVENKKSSGGYDMAPITAPNMGYRGGMNTAGGDTRGAYRAPPPTKGKRNESNAQMDQLVAERKGDVKDALQHAFEVLDSEQQEPARKLLLDHDIDVDTGGEAE